MMTITMYFETDSLQSYYNYHKPINCCRCRLRHTLTDWRSMITLDIVLTQYYKLCVVL